MKNVAVVFKIIAGHFSVPNSEAMKNVVFHVFCLVLRLNAHLVHDEAINTSTVEMCLLNFTQQVFKGNHAIYYVSDGREPIILPAHRDSKSDNQYVIVNMSESILGPFNYPRYYIVQVKDVESLSTVLFQLISTQIWNIDSSITSKYLIMISSFELRAAYEVLWDRGITNAAILPYKNKTKIYLNDPFHPGNRCGKMVKVMSVFNCGSLKIFRRSHNRSYEDCLIDFVTPYRHEDIHFQNIITRFILGELQKYLKLQVKFINRNNSERVRGNIVIFIENDDHSIYDSKSICIDHFGWVIFLNKVPTLRLLLCTFETKVWVTIGATFMLTSLTWLVINKVTTKRFGAFNVFTNVWCLTFLGCIPKIGSLLSLKTLVLFYMWFIVVMQTAFKSDLAKILTIEQYEPTIDSVAKLANSNLPLCMPQSLVMMHFLENKTADSTYTKLKTRIVPTETWKNSNCVHLIYLQDIQILKDNNYKFVYFADDTLTPFKYSFTVSIGYHFKEILDNFVNVFVENGISEYVISINHWKNTRRDKNEMEMDEPKVLTLDNVYGVFVFWAAGIAVSIAVFIFEILGKKC
ncbi:hypothetical protein FQA39_LY10049 [Lamprigera yunnana]|nr:hypothetical protein FQA39_LY10049 [Lamprigera yunnana]